MLLIDYRFVFHKLPQVGRRVGAYRCSRSWLEILRKGWACTATIAGVLIVGHDRFLTYYGTKLTSNAGRTGAAERVSWNYTQPAKPVQNAFIESFNSKLRDE